MIHCNFQLSLPHPLKSLFSSEVHVLQPPTLFPSLFLQSPTPGPSTIVSKGFSTSLWALSLQPQPPISIPGNDSHARTWPSQQPHLTSHFATLTGHFSRTTLSHAWHPALPSVLTSRSPSSLPLGSRSQSSRLHPGSPQRPSNFTSFPYIQLCFATSAKYQLGSLCSSGWLVCLNQWHQMLWGRDSATIILKVSPTDSNEQPRCRTAPCSKTWASWLIALTTFPPALSFPHSLLLCHVLPKKLSLGATPLHTLPILTCKPLSSAGGKSQNYPLSLEDKSH